MLDAATRVLETAPSLAYALVFGSVARGAERPESDLDLAVGLFPGTRLSAAERGALVAELETACGRDVDLVVIMASASIPLRHRIFREGQALFVRDRPTLVRDKAQAIIDYVDFRPLHELMVAGALRAAARG